MLSTDSIEVDNRILLRVALQEYFHTMVERSVSVSITNVKDYVHTFMSDQIAKAHMKISNYSALYADAMTAALNAKTLSEPHFPVLSSSSDAKVTTTQISSPRITLSNARPYRFNPWKHCT